MGRVITPNFQRREKPAHPRPVPQAPAEPLFTDAEIWSRDYARADGVIFGICALAAILSRHLGQEGSWPALLLGLLDAAHRQMEPGPGQLCQAARDIKALLVSETRPDNAQDFSAALLIADLIEYTPRYRATSGS